MAIIKPATPGFLTTLVATALLAVVSFSVPYFQSVFFLKASLAAAGQSGDITFGTLGYCVVLNSSTTCSNATVGYELDINKLVGNDLPIKIPEVVVKWVTYALVLHIVAFGLAAISAVFGLLAHVREMSMSCFSSCIAGFAATVALIAFIFDIAFFFIAKSRLNAVKGGSASFGNAAWLTLAAWILLFLSGCFYGLGRCCIKRRPRSNSKSQPSNGDGNNYGGYADQMRLDAVKAEADRKARQRQGEVGLPAFQEYDPSQPLHAKVDNDEVYVDDEDGVPYRDNATGVRPYRQHNQAPSGYAGGYVQGTPGNRAIDEFNSPSRISNNAYPPPQNRRNSVHTMSTTGYSTTGYSASQYGHSASAPTPPPVNNQYLSTAPYQGHDQYDSSAGQNYGHAQGGTSYHSTATHQQYPSTQYDAYSSQPPPRSHYQDSGFNPETYNSTAFVADAGVAAYQANPYNSPPSVRQPDHNYTLGGGNYESGYGTNPVPDHTQQHVDNQHFPSPYDIPSHPSSPPRLSSSPAPITTNVAAIPIAGPTNTSPVKGPRNLGSPGHQYSDSPPSYEAGPSQPSGVWGEKH